MIPLLLANLVLVQAPGSGPAFAVQTTESAPLEGQVERLATGWSVTLRTTLGERVEAAAGSVIGLRRLDRALPPWPSGSVLLLANGDRIGGTVVGGDGRNARFVPAFARQEKPVEWSVPLSAITAVWVTALSPEAPVDPADYSWTDGASRKDAILLRNGDVLRGTLEAFTSDPAGVRIKSGSEHHSPPFARVAAIAFDPALARPRRPKGPYARLVVADGSRITLTDAASDGRTLTGKTPHGVALELPLTQVIALDIVQGKAAYLSDLKPKSATVVGYNTLAWPWAADRTVKRAPLRIGPHTFDKGLGTHPKTVLTYDLGGKYRRFEAVVGLDAVSGRRGAAEVRILVDGKEKLGLMAATAPKPVAVDVTGAKELTLVVDFGTGGDVEDDVNWGDARLVE